MVGGAEAVAIGRVAVQAEGSGGVGVLAVSAAGGSGVQMAGAAIEPVGAVATGCVGAMGAESVTTSGVGVCVGASATGCVSAMGAESIGTVVGSCVAVIIVGAGGGSGAKGIDAGCVGGTGIIIGLRGSPGAGVYPGGASRTSRAAGAGVSPVA